MRLEVYDEKKKDETILRFRLIEAAPGITLAVVDKYGGVIATLLYINAKAIIALISGGSNGKLELGIPVDEYGRMRVYGPLETVQDDKENEEKETL